jgi:hypothetical protein
MMARAASFEVLSLCTARPGAAAAADRLRFAFARVTNWHALVSDAESHGLDSLLFAHVRECRFSLPPYAEMRLKTRCVQHAHAAAVRARVIGAVLDELDGDGIPALLLKGAALAHLVYPSPLLRPMRDVDLLVPADCAGDAWRRLRASGFAPSGPDPGRRHHHLQGLVTDADGVAVHVEIHRRLLGAIPFVRPAGYDDLAARSQAFECGGRPARTLGREDMLWHVYAHAFAIDVLRPDVRLISVADLVAAVEGWVDVLDWVHLRQRYPRVARALPHIGQITPWSARVEQRVGPPPGRAAVTACGTVAQRMWRNALSPRIWWPTSWWFDVRYGIDGPVRRAWHRAITHPATVVVSALDFGWWKYVCPALSSMARHVEARQKP